MHTAQEFKIYKQLSDEEMTSRGYSLHVDKRQSEDVYWSKSVKFSEDQPETYCIEIKESVASTPDKSNKMLIGIGTTVVGAMIGAIITLIIHIK